MYPKKIRERGLKLLSKESISKKEIRHFKYIAKAFKKNNQDWREEIPIEPRKI